MEEGMDYTLVVRRGRRRGHRRQELAAMSPAPGLLGGNKETSEGVTEELAALRLDGSRDAVTSDTMGAPQMSGRSIDEETNFDKSKAGEQSTPDEQSGSKKPTTFMDLPLEIHVMILKQLAIDTDMRVIQISMHPSKARTKLKTLRPQAANAIRLVNRYLKNAVDKIITKRPEYTSFRIHGNLDTLPDLATALQRHVTRMKKGPKIRKLRLVLDTCPKQRKRQDDADFYDGVDFYELSDCVQGDWKDLFRERLQDPLLTFRDLADLEIVYAPLGGPGPVERGTKLRLKLRKWIMEGINRWCGARIPGLERCGQVLWSLDARGRVCQQFGLEFRRDEGGEWIERRNVVREMGRKGDLEWMEELAGKRLFVQEKEVEGWDMGTVRRRK